MDIVVSTLVNSLAGSQGYIQIGGSVAEDWKVWGVGIHHLVFYFRILYLQAVVFYSGIFYFTKVYHLFIWGACRWTQRALGTTEERFGDSLDFRSGTCFWYLLRFTAFVS